MFDAFLRVLWHVFLVRLQHYTAFIAHYILRTASQDTGLYRCIKVSYLTDWEAVWNLSYIETDIQSSLLLLRFQFTFRPVSFISFRHMVLQVLQ